jgi:amino acid transporter
MPVPLPDDDYSIREAGYKPQLKRGLHFFASFSVAFSAISILTGLFAGYGFVLQKAGPFGFWSWWLVVLGHTLVALVFADMAGRIALAGSLYNWTTRLAGPFVGWLAGWMLLGVWAISGASVNVTLVPILRALTGVAYSPLESKCICVFLIVLQALINIYGVRLASKINLIAVATEIAALIGFAILIGVFAAAAGHLHPSLLFSLPQTQPPYWQGFLMACLLGIWTFIGFEGSADVGEETIGVHSVAPRGIITSILTGGVLGFLFIAIFTMAIPDVAKITASGSPLADIAHSVLGVGLANMFLVFVVVSVFACALIGIAMSARIIFAMSRDGRFPGASFFSRVSSHQIPENAVWLVAAVGIVCVLLADTATVLYAAGSVLGIAAYLTTVLSFAFGHKKVAQKGAFTLGIWHWPVIILAVAWLIVELLILTVPEEFHPVAVATGCVLLVGLIIYPFIRYSSNRRLSK